MGQVRWIRLEQDGPARPEYRIASYGQWQPCIGGFQPTKDYRPFHGKEHSPGFFHFCWLLSVGYEHVSENVIESNESESDEVKAA